MQLRKYIRIPVFDSDDNSWLGVLYMYRDEQTHDYIEEQCDWEDELLGAEREMVEEFIELPVATGWWTNNGGPSILVVIGDPE